MKEELKAYYKRTDTPTDEAEKARVVQLVSESVPMNSAFEKRGSISFWRFLIEQLRFVNPLAWVVQIALLVGMFFLISVYGSNRSIALVVMATAILSVAVATPTVFKSFENDLAELEASCCHDSVQVLVSRLTLFGIADVLWMSIASWLVPALTGGEPFRIFLYAATPFFAFCALCFYLSRIMNGRCVKACIVTAICVIIAIWGSIEVFPHWYSDASMVIWTIALLVALIFAVHEARRMIVQVMSCCVLLKTPSVTTWNVS